MSSHPLRDRREALGLSQAVLARRAGVSRALVAAVEGGRHAPGVTAAIGLARAVGATVEEVFDTPSALVPEPLAGPLADGDVVVAARVGDRLVAAPVPARGGAPGWAAPAGVIADGRLVPFPGAELDALVVLGCDPALGIAAAALGDERRVLVVGASSGTAAAALADGRAHAAVVHGPAGALPSAPAGALRIAVAAWPVGVAGPRVAGEPLEAALDGRLPLVQREAGAASQQALERAARRHGVGVPPARALASGHLEAARAASLLGCAAVTYAPAAAAEGLAFAPLEEHRVELRIDRRHLGHPAVEALVAVLGGELFRRRVGAIGGYDLTDAGTVLEAA